MAYSPLLGIGFHGIGALSSSLCYTPQKKLRAWSWQTYWLAQAAVCWIVLPILGAAFTTPHLLLVLTQLPHRAVWASFLLGLCYGFGGTAFGVAIRMLGFSVTYALSIGISCLTGTVLPLLLSNEFARVLHQRGASLIVFGMFIAVTGIFFSGAAGALRDKDHAYASPGATPTSTLRKGLSFAIVAGLLSALFGVALSVGQPIADVAAHYGAGQFEGNLILIFVCSGAFLSTAVLCLGLHARDGSIKEYIRFADGPSRSLLAANFGLSALTGVLWYGQFFFYGIAHTLLRRYGFTSWAIHMTLLVLFSSLVGMWLREWAGCSLLTRVTLAASLVMLIGAVTAITLGSALGYK